MNKYQYTELLAAASADTSTVDDRLALFIWFQNYSSADWNGECFDCDGRGLYPIYEEELDENGDLLQADVVDAELR